MSTKQKAAQLVDVMFGIIYENEKLSAKPFIYQKAVECALVSVKMILEETKEPVLPMGNAPFFEYSEYWVGVMDEIRKLRTH